MRNLKKILALALVFAMAFTFTASAADFTDAAEIGDKYVDDVNMLVELGVIAGYPDGSFGPQKNITRAEFAKMAYTIKYGSDTDGNLFAAQTSAFSDVEGNSNVAWAKGYINYCANQNIVSGVGNGKFNPSGNITVAEATKMLLVILGCDPAKEGFTGANWVANVTAKAIDLGIYNGWTGDPSQLATRELVAKLMRNTIFSSVYTYSAITGMGSQKNALGTADNETLGEKTMGLQTVTGIVVANERYALDTDTNGYDLGDINGDGDLDEGESDLTSLAATGEDSDKSIVYYERYNDEKGYTEARTLEVNRALDDDMLGAKVNIYFKADKLESNGRYDYKNVEVLGNVLVHSDTVAYTVPEIATDIMPDGESSSTSEIRPYITFQVDGVEKQIKLSSDVAKIAKKNDAQTVAADEIAADVYAYAYMLDNYDIADDADSLVHPTGTAFIENMGMPTLAQYRFVSVDGGNTYSYMFKMVDDKVLDGTSGNAAYGSVTAYSETAGTIRLSGIHGLTTIDLEDVVINGEIAVDDVIVAYRANGKVVINKVDTFTAAVESFTDEDDGVILNGTTYLKWVDCDIDGHLELFDYFQDNKNAMNSGTKYYTYNGLILELEADEEEVAAPENYAVILRSYYDADLDTAYVKLGFADNTEGTYQVGKLYTKKASDPQNPLNDKASDFDLNAYVGMIVSYKLLNDGSVDLSDQYFKDEDVLNNYADGSDIVGYYDENGVYNKVDGASKEVSMGILDGKLSFERKVEGIEDLDEETADLIAGSESATYYSLNDNTIVFAMYGIPAYEEDGSINPAHDDGYNPLKARAYKLSELVDMEFEAIDTLYVNIAGNGKLADYGVGYVLLNSKTASNKYVVAASMTVGADTKGIKYQETNALGFVVSAKQYYNAATSKYYAQLVLINEDGKIEAKTIEDVKDLNSVSVLDKEVVGAIDGEGETFPQGSFVRFHMDNDGVIDVIELEGGSNENHVKTAYANEQSGLYLVNIVGERNGVVSFYDTDSEVEISKESSDSLKFHEDDGCKIISVSEDNYEGDELTTVPSRETILVEKKGNAIIQVEEGQIIRIFSFPEGYSIN